MMDFDPSAIARIGQQSTPDLVGAMGQALSMKALIDQNALQGLQLQQTRSSMDREAKLRELTTGADVSTPEGQNALIENLSRGGFTQEALQLHSQLLQAREAQGKVDKIDLELEDARNNAIIDAAAQLAQQAESLIDQGMSADQVNQQMTPVYQQYMQRLLEAKLPNGQPLLGDSERAWVQQNPNYDHAGYTSMLVGRATEGRKFIKDQREARATAARDAEARRAARAREANDSARLGLEGQRVGLERDRIRNEERRLTAAESAARSAAARQAESARLARRPPAAAIAANNDNLAAVSRLDRALALVQGNAVGELAGDKEATGMKGYLPAAILNRTDPEGVATRAAIADVGSMLIHDRSGAAVTAAEMPRLAPFIPSATDDYDTVVTKLKRLRAEAATIAQEHAAVYSEANGYAPFGSFADDAQPAAATPAPAPARPAPAAAPSGLPPGVKVRQVR